MNVSISFTPPAPAACRPLNGPHQKAYRGVSRSSLRIAMSAYETASARGSSFTIRLDGSVFRENSWKLPSPLSALVPRPLRTACCPPTCVPKPPHQQALYTKCTVSRCFSLGAPETESKRNPRSLKIKILFIPTCSHTHSKVAKRKNPSFFAKVDGKQTHWFGFRLGCATRTLTLCRPPTTSKPPCFGFYRGPKATPPFLMGDENNGVWTKIYSLGGDSGELPHAFELGDRFALDIHICGATYGMPPAKKKLSRSLNHCT